MGYYVDYFLGLVSFKEGSEEDALAAINSLHANQTEYAWVYNPPEGKFQTLEEAMRAWRFVLQGNRFYFAGEKQGDERVLFATLAPYLEGEIYARGEDGHEWGFRFRDGKMTTLERICKWVEK